MPEVRCRHRLPNPETAGCATMEKLKETARLYPHLRPCPRHKDSRGGWNWIYRTACEMCPDFVKDE